MGYMNDLAKQIYNNASEKGWHDNPVAFGDCITNIHAELSESWEEYRHGKTLNQTYYTCKAPRNIPIDCPLTGELSANGESCRGCQYAKPEGIPSELADTIIRVLDACYMYNIDIDTIVAEKMAYNKTRAYKHGGKII